MAFEFGLYPGDRIIDTVSLTQQEQQKQTISIINTVIDHHTENVTQTVAQTVMKQHARDKSFRHMVDLPVSTGSGMETYCVCTHTHTYTYIYIYIYIYTHMPVHYLCVGSIIIYYYTIHISDASPKCTVLFTYRPVFPAPQSPVTPDRDETGSPHLRCKVKCLISPFNQ